MCSILLVYCWYIVNDLRHWRSMYALIDHHEEKQALGALKQGSRSDALDDCGVNRLVVSYC